MKRNVISLALTLVLCLGLVPMTALAAEPSFSDVAPDAWYTQGVKTCAENGIMVGTGTDTFSPDKVLSQAECLVLALRLHDLMNGGDGIFDPAPEDWNLTDGGWTRDAAWYQMQQGPKGMSTAFNSKDANREFFAYNLAAAVGTLPALRTGIIPDVDREGGSGGRIYNLYEAGILIGTDEQGTFDPDGTLTRAQAAVMVARVLDESQRITAPIAKSIRYDDFGRDEARLATVEEFYHRPFEALPQELRNSLTWDNEVRTLEGYRCRLRHYIGPGIVIVTTEASEEALQDWLEQELDESGRTEAEVRAEYEQEKGREWLYSVTITDNSYATVPGLKVGNTVAEAEALGYPLSQRLNADGTASFGDTWEHSMDLCVENGVVKELCLKWGIGRYTGKYWDL